MISFGPLPLPLVLIAIAWGLGALTGWLATRKAEAPRPAVASTLFDMTLVGFVVARLGFILAWWPLYAKDPWAMFRLGDGGYLAWAGVVAALLFGAFRVARSRALGRPLAASALVAALAWTGLTTTVRWHQEQTVALPSGVLTGLDGRSTRLEAFRGRPLVVNLWTTWCPTCRRGMPTLSEAQDWYTDVQFAFVNQGEDMGTITRHLAAEGLVLDRVLLDPLSTVAAETGARGLPTTLFFDADGRLAFVHVGELTRAGLAHRLASFSDRPPMG